MTILDDGDFDPRDAYAAVEEAFGGPEGWDAPGMEVYDELDTRPAELAMSDLLKTPLHDWHVARGGVMVDFAGWSMPVRYASITEEHRAVRTACGLFDVSHMGRLTIDGPDALVFLNRVLTNDVARIASGRVRYSLVCNEAGGILDDVLVYHEPETWRLVVNASNRTKIVDWFERHRGDFEVTIDDRTTDTCMVAVQGPNAARTVQPLLGDDVTAMRYYTSTETTFEGAPVSVSRTGYTGEDGLEIIGPSELAEPLCAKLVENGAVTPCGLGCRDTLRLEAAMPLYGHELNESTDPLTAGLDFAVKLEADDFIGRAALLEVQQRGPTRSRVGLELEGRRIAREHTPVFAPGGDEAIGEVTSGTFSPTLEKSIAMAYVDRSSAATGTPLEVDLRGKRTPATVVELPFYKRGA